MQWNARILAMAVTAVLCASATAPAQDVEGSKDHPLIKRYPGSVIREYDSKAFEEYALPVAPLNDEGKFGKTQRLEGKVTRIVYGNPPARSSLEIFRNYEQALRQAGFQSLFSCKQAECGSSIDTSVGWFGAQDVQYNRYLAARLARTEGDVYVALNVYESSADFYRTTTLHVVETRPMEAGLVTVDAAALGGDIARTGHVAVYGIYFDTGKWDVKSESEGALKQIAALLKQQPALRLHVVGHTDNVGDLSLNLDLSRKRASAVVQALAARGVAASRLRADGVGPLSPVASNEAEEGRAKNRRVELVKQ